MVRYGMQFCWVVTFATLMGGCRGDREPAELNELAVTNSYLASVIWDLCGDQTQVFCLAPAGMCPGHFDISPSQVEPLCNARLLLLFDFQTQIEDSLSRVKQRGVKTALIKSPGPLCLPQAYRTICEQVRTILAQEYPEREDVFNERFVTIETGLKALEAELPDKLVKANLQGVRVLASHRQAVFAKWLGLEVVAEFVGSDTETVSNIDDCLEKAQGRDVRFVIANKQEGTALAESLADRLGASAVVFSNFPMTEKKSEGYSDLVRGNVEALIKAAGQ